MKHVFILMISFYLLVTITGRIPVASQQQYPHSLPSGLIVVTYNEGVNYVDPISHEIQLLFSADTGRAYWSPDGTYIAVVRQPENICTYALDGALLQCVDKSSSLWKGMGGYDFPIAWSADSQHLFTLLETPNGQPQVGTIDISNQEVQTGNTLQLNGEILRRIHWSPNGQYLAYQTQSLTEQQAPDSPSRFDPLNLSVMDLRTGETRLFSPWSHDWCVSWSNDGQYLGAVLLRWWDREYDLRMTSGLTVFNTDGDIVNHIQPSYAGREVFGCPFSWSSDDTLIAYASDYRDFDGNNMFGIFTVSMDNSQTHLQKEGLYCPPTTINWSADGTHLAIGTVLASCNDIRILSLIDDWEWVYEHDSAVIGSPTWQPRFNSD